MISTYPEFSFSIFSLEALVMKLDVVLYSLIIFTVISCKQKHTAASSQSELITQQQQQQQQQPPPAPDDTSVLNKGEYRIGLYRGDSFSADKITHIIVVGSAVKEDSDQFFQSGLSRAYRYKELWPDHQVILMSSPDVKGATDEEIFNKYSIPVIKLVNKKFTADQLLQEMAAFTQIASFDFFGHSSPWAMKIGKSEAAFDPSGHYPELRNLRKNFLANAYATLNACNTGFYLAPDLSEALALPVSGALTSSMFEAIESDGHWYKEEDAHSRNYVEVNKFSYNKNLSCSLGVCTRMRAARDNYSSYWGTFSEGGLSFDKFFCNYANNEDGSCEKGMAYSLLSFPSVQPITLSSNTEDYKRVVFDWLCSTGNRESYFNRCVEGITDAIYRGDLEYQSHPSNELNCDFKSCHAKVKCKFLDEGPVEGSCSLDTIPNEHPTNIAREYLMLMKGFEAIRQ